MPFQIPMIAKVFVILLLIGRTVVEVADGVSVWIKEGEWRPLVDSTAGKIVAADFQINEAIVHLRDKQDLERIDRTLLKQKIVTEMILFFFFVYLVYRGVKAILPNYESAAINALLFLGALALVWAIEAAYMLFVMDQPFIAFKGIFNFFRIGIFQNVLFFVPETMPTDVLHGLTNASNGTI